MISVEPIESTAASVEDRLGVREPALLARESFGLIGIELQPFELIELEAQEIEPGRSVLAVRRDPGELPSQLPPPTCRLRHPPEQRVMAAEIVDDGSLSVPVEQQVMHVLAVDVDKMPAQLAQQVRGHGPIIDERARSSPRTDHAPHDALVRPLVERSIGKPGARR